MKKRLASLGMAGLMTVMSVVPAFADVTGSTDLTENNGNAKTTFEGLKDNEESEMGVDYWEALDGTFADQNDARATEVGVQRGMSYKLTIPSFISLSGAKNDPNGNKAEFYVIVDGDIGGKSKINIAPDLAGAAESTVPSGETYVAFDANKDKTGTFPLKEDNGIKKDLVAKITFEDVDWEVKGDDLYVVPAEGTESKGTHSKKDIDNTEFIVGSERLYGEHTGTVEVAKLSAGKFRNTINFDVTYTKDTTPEVTEP